MNRRLLLLVLIAGAVWVGVWLIPEKKPVKKDESSWPQVSTKGVKSVFVNGTSPYSLVQKDGVWRLEAGGNATTPGRRADSGKVEALLSFVEGAKPKRRLGPFDPAKANDYGFNATAPNLVFQGEERFAVTLGAKNPLGDGVFGLTTKEPGELFLLDSRWLDQVGKRPEAYHHLKVFDLAPDGVESVSAKTAGESFEIKREGTGFAFLAPEPFVGKPVSVPDVDMWLFALAATEATAYLRSDPGPLGAPSLRVEVKSKDRDKADLLEFFKPASPDPELPSRHVIGRSSRAEGLFLIDEDKLAKLVRTPFALRDRRVAVFDKTAASKQRIVVHELDPSGQSRVGGETHAVKDKDLWVDASTKREIPGLDMLLWRLTDLKFEGEPLKEPPAGARPDVFWEINLGGDNPEEVFRFYRDPKGPADRVFLAYKDRVHPVSDRLAAELRGKFSLGEPGVPQR